MSKLRGIVGWTGTALFGVSLAFASWYFAQAQPRPAFPFRGMVGCIIAGAICGLLWLFLPLNEREETHQADRSASEQAIETGGGDNSGSQFHVQGDLHIHGGQPSLSPAMSLRPTITEIAASPELVQGTLARAQTNLRFNLTWELLIYDQMQRSWRIALNHEPGAHKGIVLWVENVFPSQGQARDLHSLFASIRAEQHDSLSISRAYWLKQANNAVDLPSGGKLGVVVGYFPDRDTFVSYNNPRPPSDYPTFGSDYRPQGEAHQMKLIVREMISGTIPLTIQVRFAQLPRQTIIACRKLTFILPQGIMDMGECNP